MARVVISMENFMHKSFTLNKKYLGAVQKIRNKRSEGGGGLRYEEGKGSLKILILALLIF